jgi:hypothetical protein
MMTSDDYDKIIKQKIVNGEIVKVPPKTPPILIENWVVWEYTACLYTNGIILTTAELHDWLKAEMEHQQIPVNIFFANNACWVIEGARGRAKLDEDFRPRVVASLTNSPYTDIQFIAGLDYFGDYWVNFQMMLIVQPEEIEDPPRPVPPPRPKPPHKHNVTPLIPDAAVVVMALVALGLIFSGNQGLQVLGFLGILGTGIMWFISRKKSMQAAAEYERKIEQYNREEEDWKEQKEQAEEDWHRELDEIALEREELEKNRLSRSFKWDDLRVFHEVMSLSVARVIHKNLLQKGATVKETQELSKNEEIIPKSKKDIFDDF